MFAFAIKSEVAWTSPPATVKRWAMESSVSPDATVYVVACPGTTVGVGLGVAVGDGVAVGVGDGVRVGVALGDALALATGVGSPGVADAAAVALGVPVCTRFAMDEGGPSWSARAGGKTRSQTATIEPISSAASDPRKTR